MYRDFSEASKNKLLGLVSDVENEKWCNFTDWVGDRWLDFESWIGTLNIKNSINDVNSYHKKVIDKNNTTQKSIKNIFNKVASVDKTYENVFGNVSSLLKQWNSYVQQLDDIVNPSNGNYNSRYMQNKLNNILAGIEKDNIACLRDRMIQNVDGELTFNEEIIYEYMKKNPAEMTDAEQMLLLEVIAQLKDTVAIYESLAKYGTDELGADIANYVNWISEDTKYESFSAISAHYNDIYVNLLEYISEQSEDEKTFAASLLTLGLGESVINVLGVETYENLKDIIGTKSTFKAYLAKYKTDHGEAYFGKLEANEKTKLKLDNYEKLNEKLRKWKESKEDDWRDALKKKSLYDEYKDLEYFDKDGNPINQKDAPKFYKREVALGEIKGEKSASVSFLDTEFDTLLGGKANVTIGNAEAHGSFSGGLYVLNNDGERVISPGVSAEVGVSVTGFRGTYENQLLGNENLGLNINTEMTAMSASANAGVDLNVLGKDEDGNIIFDPQVNVGVDAEAVLVEAEGSVGVNVLGGEVGVKGSVKVGVGVNADVGYKDGVFRCEIGASLGVGFDVGLEVDVGGMVNTVADTAKSAWNGLKKGWNNLWG